MSTTITRTRRPPLRGEDGLCRRPWTWEEFLRAAELGVFGPEERLELLDGEIIEKMPPGGPHAGAVSRATRILIALFGDGYHVRPQLPLILTWWSGPEPDVVVVPGSEYDYLPDHPKAADALLVVEVSDTTLAMDRGRKCTAYARARIGEYWILNLGDRQLEVHRDPRGGRYRSVTILHAGDTIAPLAMPQATVRVADLLPPPLTAPE